MSDNLYYVARAAGLVSLLLLTGTVLLGILGPTRVSSAGWPRFAIAGLHRNVALLTLSFVTLHVVTMISYPYSPNGWPDAVVPFLSGYEPLWVGLGTTAFDLLLALAVSSLLRPRINARVWRALHWAAYACWPVALAHGIGVGSDTSGGWPLVLALACAAAVLAGAGWRLVAGRRTGTGPEPTPSHRTFAGRATS